jgi:hypothetical protein
MKPPRPSRRKRRSGPPSGGGRTGGGRGSGGNNTGGGSAEGEEYPSWVYGFLVFAVFFAFLATIVILGSWGND